MKAKELEQLLRQAKAQIPAPARQEYFRERLLQQIKFQQFNQTYPSLAFLTFREFITNLFLPWRLVESFGMTAVVFLIVASLGVGSAVASQFTAPGETFYGMRVAIERAPLALPGSDATKIQRELTLVKNHQQELAEIMASSDKSEQKSKQFNDVARVLNETIASAQRRVQQISEQPGVNRQLVVNAAANVKTSTSGVKRSLAAASRQMISAAMDSKTKTEIKASSQAIKAAELSALGVLVKLMDDVPAATPTPSLARPENETDNSGIGTTLVILLPDETSVTANDESLAVPDNKLPADQAATTDKNLGSAPDNAEVNVNLKTELNDAINDLETELTGVNIDQPEADDLVLDIDNLLTKQARIKKATELIASARQKLALQKWEEVMGLINQIKLLVNDLQ